MYRLKYLTSHWLLRKRIEEVTAARVDDKSGTVCSPKHSFVLDSIAILVESAIADTK